ncbi:PH domain-containing protein [Acinetobacter baumannii]|uniref:PH domain-containing protein n=1 Tax=Acinetobacter baumannii TaxID=470 RepID=UPI002340C4CB|nr:PH domain-containing protein [Acinetobacter baumannii]MDC4922803.1 PH domain-containing protein [Acinetobacter baumannii]MDC4991793.1 PH domain-containing protein [Acinetobacter baumannii]MDV7506392.1 PH domain-containing protein [Acinetobacter baumannii]MDV7610497.1 PH domain-containing protein [Acinetobacter baumannii]
MKFRSKIDWWLLLIFVVITANIIFKIYQEVHHSSIGTNFSHLMIYSLVILVIWLPIFSTYYVVETNILVIKSLIFRWKINIDDITQIEPTHNPLSSPALSLDRLKISYMKNGRIAKVMISPKDKEGFLNTLRNNPNAKF